MLQITFVKTGKTHDFSDFEKKDVALNLIRGNREPLCFHLEDCTVAVNYDTGSIAAINQLEVDCAKRTGIDAQLIENIMVLAIDDEQSYVGIEEFFADFPIRFVP